MAAVRLAGVEDAFDELYATHVAYVWSAIRAHGVPSAAAEDLVQDVFVILARRWPSLDRERPLRPWLFGVVRFVVRRHRRTAARRGPDTLSVDPEHLERRASTTDAEPGDTMDAKQLLSRFLDGLDPNLRRVFVLAELVEMTAREIGEVLGISPNTASSRLRTSRSAFDRFVERHRARERSSAVVAEARKSLAPSRAQCQRVGAMLAVRFAPTTALAKLELAGALGWGKAIGLGGAATLAIVAAVGLSSSPAPARDGVVATVSKSEPLALARTKAPVPHPPKVAFTEQPVDVASRPVGSRTAARGPSSSASLDRELQALQQIESLLPDQPDEALRRIAALAREIREPMLLEEREILRFVALCAAERVDEAERISAHYGRLHRSARLARLSERGCLEHETSSDRAVEGT